MNSWVSAWEVSGVGQVANNHGVRKYDGFKCETSCGSIFQRTQNPTLYSISTTLRICIHVSALLSSRTDKTIPCLSTKSRRRIGDVDVTPHSLSPLLVGWMWPHLMWGNSPRYSQEMWLVGLQSKAGHGKIVNTTFGISTAALSSIIRRHLSSRSAQDMQEDLYLPAFSVLPKGTLANTKSLGAELACPSRH
jgi:hypothetical protein